MMDAVLEKVTRTDMEGEETEIAHDVPCEVDTKEEVVVLTAGYDLGILVFVLCVLYVFALIKKGYDRIYGKH